MKSLFYFLAIIISISFAYAGDFSVRSNKFKLGTGTSADQTLEFNLGLGSLNPKIKWSASANELQFSNNGSTFFGLPSPGTSGNVMQSNGSDWISSSLSSTFHSPTIQILQSTGTATGYLFTVSPANATVGATYTNNGNTYTVLSTVSGGTLLFTSQASAPLSSGTLTKASGTGDATITFSAEQPLATYTTPSSPSPIYLKIRMIGGGGGGGGQGGGGNTGTYTVFGSNLLIAPGGPGGGGNAGVSSQGSAGIVNSPAFGFTFPGNQGDNARLAPGTQSPGGVGGAGPWGGAAASGGINNSSGLNASGNSGSGGGGGSSTGSSGWSCAGGTAGSYVEATVTSPGATYYYSIGSGGTGGPTGTGAAGGNGGSGQIVVEEHYQ